MVGLALAFAVIVGWVSIDHYLSTTTLVPDTGGEYVEGIVGRPVAINPVLAISDADRDICSLVFSGLTRIDDQGRLMPDLARSWEISEDNLSYTFHLRDDALWQDGEPFSADDVVFTIGLVQSAEFPGPITLRNSWLGVTVEKTDALTVVFTLQDPYAPFIENTILGILPRHRLENVAAGSLSDDIFNREPVGTGPFSFGKIVQTGQEVEAVVLEANLKYYEKAPYLESVRFRFFDDSQSMITALRQHSMEGIHLVTPDIAREVSEIRNLAQVSSSIPRYQAVFFNTQGKAFLQEVAVRQALSLSIDRQRIIDEAVGGQAIIADGPLTQASWAYTPPSETVSFDLDRARTLLSDAGWSDEDQDGILEKDGEKLSFNLLSDDAPERVQAALLIADMWKQVGVSVEVRLFGVGTFIDEYLRKRDFDAVLFGQSLSWDPDIYAYWHSTQVSDPGLNISSYSNPKVDKLLEDARRLVKVEDRQKKYAEIQTVIRADAPAAFLFIPNYVYAVRDTIHEVKAVILFRPSDRFKDIVQWYEREKRVKKVVEKTPAVIDDPSTLL